MPPPPKLLAPIRDQCATLPGTEEIGEGSVGDPVWKVNKRIFVMQHGHEGQPSLWIKAARGIQEALIATDPVRWFRPPYVGHNGWVGTWLDDTIDWLQVEDLVEEAWRLTASKAQLRAYDAQEAE